MELLVILNMNLEKYRISFKNVCVWLADQLTHPLTLLQRKSWGVFSVYAHVRRSDRRPKAISDTKERALATADFMTEKYGGQYSVYKCVYCNGWHVAKESQSSSQSQEAEKAKVSAEATKSSIVNSELNLEKLMTLVIPDLVPVYGGVRGRTLSSPHQKFAWPIVKECGIRTIIDLRADGINTHLSALCEKFGIEYFYYPVDKKTSLIEQTVKRFPQLCEKIDAGNFYIACAMGLHRTDIALCCYWIFYGADKGLPAPEIRGYRMADGHNVDKIMRLVNAFYRYMTYMNGEPPFPQETLNQRKKIITEKAKC